MSTVSVMLVVPVDASVLPVAGEGWLKEAVSWNPEATIYTLVKSGLEANTRAERSDLKIVQSTAAGIPAFPMGVIGFHLGGSIVNVSVFIFLGDSGVQWPMRTPPSLEV